jgi:hypothetical protein
MLYYDCEMRPKHALSADRKKTAPAEEPVIDARCARLDHGRAPRPLAGLYDAKWHDEKKFQI